MGHWVAGIGCLIFLISAVYAGLIGIFTFGWYRSNQSADGGRRPVLKAVPEGSAARSEDRGRRISIIIAAKNVEKHILDLLEDLLLQDYPKELSEIIIVDDHSTDSTGAIVKNFIQKEKAENFRLLTLSEEHKTGKKAALTYGIHEAAGDIIITTDADCIMGNSWIYSMAEALGDDMQMVFGPVSYHEEKGFLSQFQTIEFLSLVASGGGAAKAGVPFICNGANLAYRKEAFLQVEGFEGNEEFLSGDDVFLLHKMKKAFGNRAVSFNPDVRSIVMTHPVKGLKAFISQRIRWASKSRGYRDLISILTAIIVFSYSLTLLSSLIASIFNPFFFLIFWTLLFMKILIDYRLIRGITGFMKRSSLMKWYLPFQLIYPVYIVITGMMSLFGRKRW